MAKATFSCAKCGASVTVGGAGYNRKRADDLAEWKEKQGDICSDCWKKEQNEQHQRDAQQNAKAELPALTGSEKQILWAEGIRTQKLTSLESVINELPIEDRNDQRFPLVIESLKGKTSASWWIDRRDCKIISMMGEMAREIETPLPNEKAKVVQEAAAAAIGEATVSPKDPVTPTVAEIHVENDSVVVDFPEKREDFREIVKFRLGYQWKRASWQHEFPSDPLRVTDFAAETGHTLLASGFPIRIFNEEIRKKAIDSVFTPYPTRWIRARTYGAYPGWFSLSWKRPDDLYRAAIRLPGARYDSPNVVAPASSFEAVLDFAERYDFTLSEMAHRVITEQRVIATHMVHADVAPIETPAPIIGQPKPVPLEIPVDVEIDNDLLD